MQSKSIASRFSFVGCCTLREGLWIGWLKTEVTHAHETFGDHVEQEAADEFVGIEGHGGAWSFFGSDLFDPGN